MQKDLKVAGMHCQHCAMRIRQALMAIQGVEEVKVQLDARLVSVLFKGDIESGILEDAVRDAGYHVIV